MSDTEEENRPDKLDGEGEKEGENAPDRLEEEGDEEGEESDEEEQDDELEEFDRYWPLPAEVKVDLTVSFASKTVSAFAFNNAGSRFSAGSHDHEMKIWDFDRPGASCGSQPCGQTVIKNLDYSKDDEQILVIPSGCQAVIVGKDGIVLKESVKGDQYISDMAHTKGHVQMLNDGCWNLKDKTTFITSSNDGTIRIWDANKLSQQLNVVKIRTPGSGLKAVPNRCCYSRDSLSIATGCNDGSFMMWDTRRKFVTTSACIRGAHLKGSEITGIDFSYGLSKVCTRSEDESCKLWDLRKLKEPLATRNGLCTLYSNSDCSFSPNDEIILVGTSGSSKVDPGQLIALDANSDLSVKTAIDNENGAVIRCKWHPKINHIGYSCSNGSLVIAYDRRKSLGGFSMMNEASKFTFKRKNRPSNSSEEPSNKRIFTPNSLPLFRDDPKDSQTARASAYKPEVSVNKVKPVGSTLSSYVAQRIAKRRA